MPKVDNYTYTAITSEIKSLIARNPTITNTRLREELSKKGHLLEIHYIGRLVKKVKEGAFHEVNRDVLKRRIARARMRFDEAVGELSKIGYWKWEFLSEGVMPPTASEKIMALVSIMKQDLALMEAEIAAGIYSDVDPVNIHEADWRSTPLDPEKREEIMRALKAVIALGAKNPSGRSYKVESKTIDAQPAAITTGTTSEKHDTGNAPASAAATPQKVSQQKPAAKFEPLVPGAAAKPITLGGE